MSIQRSQQYKGFTLQYNHDTKGWIAYRNLEQGPDFYGKTEKEIKRKIKSVKYV